VLRSSLRHEGAHVEYHHHLVPVGLLTSRYMVRENTRLSNCEPCGVYNKCWSCPGLNQGFPAYNDDNFSNVLLYSFWVDLEPVDESDTRPSYARVQAAYAVVAPLALQYGNYLEQQFGGKLMIDGRCASCKVCTAALDPPLDCAYPDKLRSSLEALGFDVIRVSNNILKHPLKWHVDRGLGRSKMIPAYVTVVHGLLTHMTEEPTQPYFEDWMSPAATTWLRDWRTGRKT
jgi:predicted metal-binding protein